MKLPRSRRKPKDQGAALVLVLWGAVVMSIIAAAAARQASTTAITVNTTGELTRARALADAGVRAGWTAYADGRLDDQGAVWGCRSGEDLLLVRVRPETARIDINLAEPDLIAALLVEAGAEPALADRIAEAAVEYRSFGQTSEEDFASGDEGAGPQAEGNFVRGPFASVEELGYLPGMDAALFRVIAGDITVHGRSPEVDARFASRRVRAALARIGAPVAPAEDVTGSDAVSFEGSLMDVRAIGVTRSGAVFVREGVVEGPLDSVGTPKMLRLVQGRLAEGEVLPDGRGAPACAQGFAVVGKASM